MQVEASKKRIDALTDLDCAQDAAAERITLECLRQSLLEQQTLLSSAQADESSAHEAVAETVAGAQALDQKAARLKKTGESLAQGIAQMGIVRSLRSEALQVRQQEEVQRELCQQKRKESSQLQRQVCRLWLRLYPGSTAAGTTFSECTLRRMCNHVCIQALDPEHRHAVNVITPCTIVGSMYCGQNYKAACCCAG